MTFPRAIRAIYFLLSLVVAGAISAPVATQDSTRGAPVKNRSDSLMTAVVKVISVTDTHLHYPIYIVKFQIIEGPSAGQFIRCMVRGAGELHMALKADPHTAYKISYLPDAEFLDKSFDAMELVAIKRVKDSTGRQDGPVKIDTVKYGPFQER